MAHSQPTEPARASPAPGSERPPIRYNAPAAAMHWIIAALLLAIIPLGIYGAEVESALAQSATNIHKALGISVLFLTVLRLTWRLIHRAPPLPDAMGRLSRIAAHAVHGMLYMLMLGIPLSGWIMSSAVPERHPIGIVGVLVFPFLPIGPDMQVAMSAHSIHLIAGWSIVALIALHVAAALKHQFYDKHELISRMWPASERKIFRGGEE